jgi:lipoyl(octanoyl) transferase
MSGRGSRLEEVVTESARTCWVVELGLVPYSRAYELQQRLVSARKAGHIPDVLLLCEHPHVITLGRSGKREHLRVSDHLLQQMHVEYYPTDRGGDVTYHGPGQVVGYPILNLAEIRRDVAWYVRQLEEAMIRASAECGVTATRQPRLTGVWVELPGAAPEKLAAIGVHLSRWVTSHGFAYNVSTDLRYFELIVPCGIPDRWPTSLERLLCRVVRREEVAPRIVAHLGEIIGRHMQAITLDTLEEQLRVHEEPALLAPAEV